MRLVVPVLLAALVPGPAAAQDQTLADIRQELSVLWVEIQRLNRELSTTGGPSLPVQGDVLQRIDTIERELQRMTARTEELEFRIETVVRDGTNRVGDLEFRLCELEPDCDIATLGQTPSLGGVEPAPPATAVVEPAAESQLAVGERADFDAAKAALDEGRYQDAVDAFERFNASYTGGPLTGDAHYYRGVALEGLGQTAAAARAYLDSFSGSPEGPRAPDALLALGLALNKLGQPTEACLMLAEVSTRFPGSEAAAKAQAASAELSCS